MAARRVLLRAIQDVQAGREAPTVMRPGTQNSAPQLVVRSDVLLPSEIDWHGYWEKDEVMVLAGTVRAGGA